MQCAKGILKTKFPPLASAEDPMSQTVVVPDCICVQTRHAPEFGRPANFSLNHEGDSRLFHGVCYLKSLYAKHTSEAQQGGIQLASAACHRGTEVFHSPSFRPRAKTGYSHRDRDLQG